jgi:acyl carrier protein
MTSTAAVPTEQEIGTRVRATLRPLFGDALDGADDTTELTVALGDRYDSLAALECVSRVEAEFGIEVDFVAHDVRHHFASLGRIAEFVRDQLEDLAVLGTP